MRMVGESEPKRTQDPPSKNEDGAPEEEETMGVCRFGNVGAPTSLPFPRFL